MTDNIPMCNVAQTLKAYARFDWELVSSQVLEDGNVFLILKKPIVQPPLDGQVIQEGTDHG